ncbi:MAG: Trk system potassium transporter TrkA [Saprospiraceae bacterium]|jgi:trk system potassium uptake protein TrkA
MKIVIAGAGGIGFHLAKLLSSAQHDIIIIDSNRDVLDYAQSHLDVQTVYGDASSITLLKDINLDAVSIFLAVTTRENDNLMACSIAKKLGAKQTIARINNISNLEKEAKNIFRELGVDKIISPSLLASQEILRLLEFSQVTDSFDFENGKVSLIGLKIEEYSFYEGKTIEQIKKYKSTSHSPVAILRGNETILPRANTIMRRGDHIYFIINKSEVDDLLEMIGKPSRKIKSIMFIGGNVISLTAAKKLEYQYNISIIEENEKQCKILLDELNNTLVIKGDPSNIELLKEEGLEKIDAFIAVTPNSETNIITSLMAENLGVYKTIALVENLDYTHISQNIGVDTMINKKIIAANNIFRYVRKGKVEAIASLHGVDAEVIEYAIHKESRLTRLTLKHLKLPSQTIIGAVIRGDDTIIPTGDFILQLHDKVIVLALPGAIGRIEDIFR